MKKLLIASLLIVGFSANAETVPKDICKKMSDASEVIFDLRNMGEKLSDAYELAQDDPVVQSLIVNIYKMDEPATELQKDKQKTEFSKRLFIACLDIKV